MFTPFVRGIFLIIGSILTYYYFVNDNLTSAYLTLFGVVLVVWGYFKNGTVYLAWKKIKSQDFEKAERILKQTKYPELLKREQRGFYHFSKALIKMNKGDPYNAENDFKEALGFGVRTENNRAIINLNLADIEIEKGRIEEAKTYLKKVRFLKYNKILEPEILKIERKASTVTGQ